MRDHAKWLKPALLVLTLTVIAGCDSRVDDDTIATIYRDEYGTPHVFADDNYGVYFGFGYAVAEDRLFQMEMLRRTAQGRVAEVLGGEFVDLDRHIRTIYDHRAITAQLAQLEPAQLAILQGYADGFSRRVGEVLADPELLPKEFSDHQFDPVGWQPYDVAMLFVGAIAHRYADFNSERDNLTILQSLQQQHGPAQGLAMFNMSKWLTDQDSVTTVPTSATTAEQRAQPTPSYLSQLPPLTAGEARVAIDDHGRFAGITSDSDVAEQFAQLLSRRGFSYSPEFAPASNYWATGADKTLDAEGVVVNGPQFGWGAPSYVYGIGLHGGDFDLAGNTLLALPSILFAHNNHISWGSTAGLSDQVDLFVETLNPQNPEQYLHNGSYRDFERWSEVITVKDADPITVTARRSVHGMVVEHATEQGLAWSRARSWEGGELDSLFGWVELSKAKNLDQAQQAISAVTTNINFYYTDSAGNLGYTHGGRYPQRHPQQDPRLPAPGSGEFDWQGMRPYSDNPTVRNPAQGYLSNWNNRPSRGWASSDLWNLSWSASERVALINRELERQPALSVDQIWAVNRAVSDAELTLPFIIDHLIAALAASPADSAERRALTLLSDWSGNWTLDDNGFYGAEPALMQAWIDRLLAQVFSDDVGELLHPWYADNATFHHPQGPSSHPAVGSKIIVRTLDQLARGEQPEYDFFNGQAPAELLASTFAEAVAELTEQFGADYDGWQLSASPMVWRPVNFRGVPQAAPEAETTLPGYMNRGTENNLFIARGDHFEAYDVIPPGQSGQINSDGSFADHYSDQMAMFSGYRYKSIPFSRAEAEQRAQRVQRLLPAAD